jgi:hypothetical protein
VFKLVAADPNKFRVLVKLSTLVSRIMANATNPPIQLAELAKVIILVKTDEMVSVVTNEGPNVWSEMAEILLLVVRNAQCFFYEGNI